MSKEKFIVLGLAGIKSLMEAIHKTVEQVNTKNINECLIVICRHSFSIESQYISHNQQIMGETNFEFEYYEYINSLRNEGYNIITFTQGSSTSGVNISRWSGVKLNSLDDNANFEGNPFDNKPTKEQIEINNELARIINKNNIFLKKNIKQTALRDNFYGTFLHDAKVYFTSCQIEKLIENNIIIEKQLKIYENGFVTLDINSKNDKNFIVVKENIVNPEKINDYSKKFNNWLEFGIKLNVFAVSTDPGPGFFKNNGKKLIFEAQDVDDSYTLSIIPFINYVIISDDNRNFSRKDLIIFNSVEKIKEMKKQLEEYYIPCKARTYLNDLNTKNVITVLRQIVKCHGYTINSREKYIRGDKFIIYQLTPIESSFYRPINLEINDKKQCVVRFD